MRYVVELGAGHEAMAVTSRLFDHFLEHHPALIQVTNRHGREVFRTLVVRHDSECWDFTLEEEPGDHARLEVVSRDSISST